MTIPSWDETAMEVVKVYEKRSHCIWLNVAAAFYKGNKLLSIGYNGPPKGEPHCDEVGCAKMVNGKKLLGGSGLCRGAHAEANGITNAAAEGVSLKGTRVYCTYTPCYDCAKLLVNLGITELIYRKVYKDEGDPKVFGLFKRQGIIIRKFKSKRKKVKKDEL